MSSETAGVTATITPRLKARYTRDVRPALREEFQHGNIMEVGRVVKVVVNMGVGEAAHDSKMIEGAPDHPSPQVHRAVQVARGPADRRARHAARRPHVGVPRSPYLDRASPDPRLPWTVP